MHNTIGEEQVNGSILGEISKSPLSFYKLCLILHKRSMRKPYERKTNV